MVTTLSDGTALRLRPIRPDDKARLVEGLTRLSPESVHRRFLGPKREFSERELRVLTEVDGVDHVALVAVLPHDPDQLVAVGRFVRDAARPDTAEVAVVVGDPLQHKGIGRLLMGELARRARELGIERFTATMLGTNLPALRLLTGLAPGARVTVADGLQQAVAELPGRTSLQAP
jgi:GNAT superfamily N-acetyltransferase